MDRTKISILAAVLILVLVGIVSVVIGVPGFLDGIGDSQSSPDSSEPNNQLSTAATISSGSYDDQKLVDGEDDYYAVEVTEGDSIAVSISSEESDRPAVELVDADGTVHEESATSADNATITKTATQSETYYIRVYDASGESVPYSMDVGVTETGDSTPDGDESGSDDQLAAAERVSSGSYDDLEITEEETDYYAVSANAGETIEASIFFDDSTGNLQLEIINESKDILENGVSRTDNETAGTEVTENGTYYIRVYGVGESAAPYSMDVTVYGEGNTSVGPDRFEPNDNVSAAEKISPGSYEDLRITMGESDYFAVDLERGETIEVGMFFSDSIGDLDLELLDPAGMQLNTSFGNTDDEAVSATVTRNGTYYIRALGAGQASGTYTLDVNVTDASDSRPDPDRFEPNDDQSSAHEIHTGTYQYLRIDDGENDYYAINAYDNYTVEASIAFSQAMGNLSIEIYNQDGEKLNESVTTSYGEAVQVSGTEQGMHYIRVYGEDGETVPYTLFARTGL